MNGPQRTHAQPARSTAEQTLRDEVVEHPTPHAQPVGDVLDTLQAQAKDAIPDALFSDGVTAEKAPLMKRMRSEIGSAAIDATQHDTDVQAHIEVEVRCDRDEDGDAGRYQVRTEGQVARGPVTAQIPVSVEVDERDGSLRLDRDEVREEITKAVHSTADARER